MRIYLLALLVKNLAVAALGSGNKEYHVFAGCKLTQMPYAVGYLTANCVVIFKMYSRCKAQFYFVDNLAKAFERFCGLRVKGDVACEIYLSSPEMSSITIALPSVWPTSPLTSAWPFLP